MGTVGEMDSGHLMALGANVAEVSQGAWLPFPGMDGIEHHKRKLRGMDWRIMQPLGDIDNPKYYNGDGHGEIWQEAWGEPFEGNALVGLRSPISFMVQLIDLNTCTQPSDFQMLLLKARSVCNKASLNCDNC